MSTLESLATAGSFSNFHGQSWPHHTAICTAKCLELGLTIHRIVLALGVVKVLKDKFCSQAPKALMVQLKATDSKAKLASSEGISLGPHRAGQEAHMLSTCNCKSLFFAVAKLVWSASCRKSCCMGLVGLLHDFGQQPAHVVELLCCFDLHTASVRKLLSFEDIWVFLHA